MTAIPSRDLDAILLRLKEHARGPFPDVTHTSLLVGVSGPIAAGKTTLAGSLVEEGFCYARYSKSIDKLLLETGCNLTAHNRQLVGEQIHSTGLQVELNLLTLGTSTPADRLVIDGVRFKQDVDFLRELFGERFAHISVVASTGLREARFVQRDADLTKQDFISATSSVVETEVTSICASADHVVRNEGSTHQLKSAILHLAGQLTRAH